jgi:hypothetical protein
MKPQSGHVPGAASAPASNSLASIPCKFGLGCTRSGCPYAHPTKTIVPCKFGVHCTRADCMFGHPPGRVNPSSYKGLGPPDNRPHANRTMRFNTAAPEFVPNQAIATQAQSQAGPGAGTEAKGTSEATSTASATGAKDPNPKATEAIAAV